MGRNSENFKLRVTAEDATRGSLTNIADSVKGIVGAYVGFQAINAVVGTSIKNAVEYEATMKSLEAVVKSTGRNMSDVYREMGDHVGGLASKANIATGFLKGMTTTLGVSQISEMTKAIKNASIAMGEDFNTQLPMIIKAVKQLNPAILDNIGVTVRLDQVNKRIRDGYYGAGQAINEFTQQNAIFQEIMKQTLQFQGQEETFLQTNKGAYEKMTVALEDLSVSFGTAVTEGGFFSGMLNGMTEIIRALDVTISTDISWWDKLMIGIAGTTGQTWLMKDALDNLIKVNKAQELFESLGSNPFPVLAEDDSYMKYLDAKIKANEKYAQSYGQIYLDMFEEEKELNEERDEYGEWVTDQAMRNLESNLAEQIDVMDAHNRLTAERTAKQMNAIAGLAGGLVDDIADALVDGDKSFSEIFDNMADHFMKFFIKQGLAMIANIFIPGLGSLLGGIFDTPKNDRMAMTQGEHFAGFFSDGAMKRFKKFSLDYPSTLAFDGSFSGSMNGSGGGFGGGNTYHFNSPITNTEYVRNEIIPIIEESSRVGQTRILANHDSDIGSSNFKP